MTTQDIVSRKRISAYTQARDNSSKTRFSPRFVKDNMKKDKGTILFNAYGDTAHLSSLKPPKDIFEIVYDGFMNTIGSISKYFNDNNKNSNKNNFSNSDLICETQEDSLDSRISDLVSNADDIEPEHFQQAAILEIVKGIKKEECKEETESTLDSFVMSKYQQVKEEMQKTRSFQRFFKEVIRGKEPYSADFFLKNKAFTHEERMASYCMVESIESVRNFVMTLEDRFDFEESEDGKKILIGEEAKKLYKFVYNKEVDNEDPLKFSVVSYNGIMLEFRVPDYCVPDEAYAYTENFMSIDEIKALDPKMIDMLDYVPDLGVISYSIRDSLKKNIKELKITREHEKQHIIDKYIHYAHCSISQVGSYEHMQKELSAELASNSPDKIYLGEGHHQMLKSDDLSERLRAEKVTMLISEILNRGIIFDFDGRPDDRESMRFLSYMVGKLNSPEKLPEMLSDFNNYLKVKYS